jgi:DNA mismatch repair protein MutL
MSIICDTEAQPTDTKLQRIKLLSADVASKIAAGEVVERPASVLKELMENSIDAGATQIEVSIEQGGIRSIIVRDNGCGILAQDLPLALQQHATSKITSAEDLDSIYSLGFRGEALASINSVAKVSITSLAAGQESAYCLANDNVAPAAHPLGTTIKVQDLFYNTPARRKFLRSERTEYQHLEEVFRRIALSNFAVGFTLIQQDKMVKNLPVCKDQASQTRRLSTLCGQQILRAAIRIDAEQNGMRLWGWLGAVNAARTQEPHQYFFINGRIIKDRLINHAIRSAYQALGIAENMPFYCLYLDLDPVALDVNVHPTKHEVRFRDARIIHAFINDIILASHSAPEARQESNNFGATFNNSVNTNNKFAPNWINTTSEPIILDIIAQRFIVAKQHGELIIADALAIHKQLLLQKMHDANRIIELTAPVTINIDPGLQLDNEFLTWCANLGLNFEWLGANKLILRNGLIAEMKQINFELLLPKLHVLWVQQATKSAGLALVAEYLEFNGELSAKITQELLQQIAKLPNKGLWKKFAAQELSSLLTCK